MQLHKQFFYIVGILLAIPVFAADSEPKTQDIDEFNVVLANDIHKSLSENIIALSNAIDNFFVPLHQAQELI